MIETPIIEKTTESGKSTRKKIIALIEVILVRFIVYSLIANLLLNFLSTYGFEYEQNIGFIDYIIAILWFIIPIGITLLFRRNLSSIGLNFKWLHTKIDIGMKAFLILLITFFGYTILSFANWSYLALNGSLLLTICFIISFILIKKQLDKIEVPDNYETKDPIELNKKKSNLVVLIIIMLFPIIIGIVFDRLTGIVISTLVWQFIFSGFGEELFFRGYIQGRLNTAFGRPWKIGRTSYGPGLIITSLIFAITHIMNTSNIWQGNYNFAWYWGLFTFVGGLCFGLLREKTNSIIPGGIAHGLDGIGEAIGIMFF